MLALPFADALVHAHPVAPVLADALTLPHALVTCSRPGLALMLADALVLVL